MKERRKKGKIEHWVLLENNIENPKVFMTA